jgi:Bacterial TSP3 repeat
MRRSALLVLLLSACTAGDGNHSAITPHDGVGDNKTAAQTGGGSISPHSGSGDSNSNSFHPGSGGDPQDAAGSTQVQDAPPTTGTTPPAPTMSTKKAPPNPSDCAASDESPMQTLADAQASGTGAGMTTRPQQLGERHGGLDKSHLLLPHDFLQLGQMMDPIRSLRAGGAGTFATGDSDGDCLSDTEELALGTDPNNPDSDGDGWFDGPCNERRKLTVVNVTTHESNDWSFFGGDDFYLIADDVRYPNNGIDDYWDGFKSGTSHDLNRQIASRVRGVKPIALAQVTVEGWDDDWEPLNTWTVDDLLLSDPIDLGAYADGQVFTKRYTTSDSDYEVTYRVDIEHFADPNPLLDGDSDNDGIKESNEARVTNDFGGIADPERTDVMVEVDWMSGHRLRTEAKRQVVTRMFEHGIQMFVWRDEEVPLDSCLTVKDAQAYYNKYFTNRGYDAFRYDIISEKIWNNASGVTWGDISLVNDSTWWISDSVMPQAGTFIHELGHTLSLTKQDTFHLIDSISWISYDSAMNYTFQALLVDYSSDTPNDNLHHDDWPDVKPGYALQWSFALVNDNTTGPCN